MPAEVRDANDQERLAFFTDRVMEIARDLKLEGVVIVAETETMHNVARMPPCPADCRTKRHCAIKVYRHGADILDRVADELEKLEK